MIAGRRRGLSPTMRRELKRRSAIEGTIGHMKTDGRLDRNFLLGQAGDAINALLAAAGHNLRLVLAALALWLAFILAAIANATTSAGLLPAHVDQAAVLVQVSTFKSHRDLMVMPVPPVFCTPNCCSIASCRLR
jgi:hypothetical protein